LVHLTSSRFFGGPERQMLGLAKALPAGWETVFASFAEGGRCDAFLEVVRRAGFAARRLRYDTPRLLAARRELATFLSQIRADVLLCHGYKADLVGRLAARRAGVPVVAVSRGWTGESAKVRWYERIDRLFLDRMDTVVCVSEVQAAKVRAAGVPESRVHVIRNSARADAFRNADAAVRKQMEAYFPVPGRFLVLSAGRLSPDKGFGVLIDAVLVGRRRFPEARFLICGDGVQREELERRIRKQGLCDIVAFAGFRPDFDEWMPNADVFVLPSFAEGLPNVLLEAHACAVPVVATAVGGTPELVLDGKTGLLVPAGNAGALASAMARLLDDVDLRDRMGAAARARVREQFTFEKQAEEYQRLFDFQESGVRGQESGVGSQF
jgi:glycosyltransferase involved in cell wall biosynthesis